MLGGWLAAGTPAQNITVIDPGPPSAMAELMARKNVRHVTSVDGLEKPDLIVVAVKPQVMETVLPTLAPLVDEDNVLLSVAAGTTLEKLTVPFGERCRAVRAMPNTPALVQRGITVCVANPAVSKQQRAMIADLLSAIGDVEWVDDEALIDPVTGVSGSGPAYVFHLAEALAAAGEAAGLAPELAAKLAQSTVAGAGELMRQSDLSPEQLRKNVTSPHGTTQAALEVLMGEGGFPDLLKRAVRAATERSRELAQQ